jgi:hypothetical protein
MTRERVGSKARGEFSSGEANPDFRGGEEDSGGAKIQGQGNGQENDAQEENDLFGGAYVFFYGGLFPGIRPSAQENENPAQNEEPRDKDRDFQ